MNTQHKQDDPELLNYKPCMEVIHYESHRFGLEVCLHVDRNDEHGNQIKPYAIDGYKHRYMVKPGYLIKAKLTNCTHNNILNMKWVYKDETDQEDVEKEALSFTSEKTELKMPSLTKYEGENEDIWILKNKDDSIIVELIFKVDDDYSQLYLAIFGPTADEVGDDVVKYEQKNDSALAVPKHTTSVFRAHSQPTQAPTQGPLDVVKNEQKNDSALVAPKHTTSVFRAHSQPTQAPTQGPLDDLLQQCQNGEAPTIVMRNNMTGQILPFRVTTTKEEDIPQVKLKFPCHPNVLYSRVSLTVQIPLDSKHKDITGIWTPAFDLGNLNGFCNTKSVMVICTMTQLSTISHLTPEMWQCGFVGKNRQWVLRQSQDNNRWHQLTIFPTPAAEVQERICREDWDLYGTYEKAQHGKFKVKSGKRILQTHGICMKSKDTVTVSTDQSGVHKSYMDQRATPVLGGKSGEFQYVEDIDNFKWIPGLAPSSVVITPLCFTDEMSTNQDSVQQQSASEKTEDAPLPTNTIFCRLCSVQVLKNEITSVTTSEAVTLKTKSVS
jgi:hypothetical protein